MFHLRRNDACFLGKAKTEAMLLARRFNCAERSRRASAHLKKKEVKGEPMIFFAKRLNNQETNCS